MIILLIVNGAYEIIIVVSLPFKNMANTIPSLFYFAIYKHIDKTSAILKFQIKIVSNINVQLFVCGKNSIITQCLIFIVHPDTYI